MRCGQWSSPVRVQARCRRYCVHGITLHISCVNAMVSRRRFHDRPGPDPRRGDPTWMRVCEATAALHSRAAGKVRAGRYVVVLGPSGPDTCPGRQAVAILGTRSRHQQSISVIPRWSGVLGNIGRFFFHRGRAQENAILRLARLPNLSPWCACPDLPGLLGCWEAKLDLPLPDGTATPTPHGVLTLAFFPKPSHIGQGCNPTIASD